MLLGGAVEEAARRLKAARRLQQYLGNLEVELLHDAVVGVLPSGVVALVKHHQVDLFHLQHTKKSVSGLWYEAKSAAASRGPLFRAN